MLLFPFIEDKCSNDILDGTLVKHHSNSNYKIKNKALQLSLSWYFHSGKQKSDNKSIDNKDKDNGSFKIK